MHNDFRKHPRAITYEPYFDKFHFKSQQLKLPSVCKCVASSKYKQLRSDYKDALVNKLNTSIAKLTQECATTLDPMKANPYIIYNKDVPASPREGRNADENSEFDTMTDMNSDFENNDSVPHKRQKRFVAAIGGFLQSAFRSATSALSGLTSTMTTAAGRVGTVVTNSAGTAASRFSPHFARVNTFLPTLKKTAYAANIASAIGVSALAIDSHLKTTKFQDHILNNVTENILSQGNLFVNGKFQYSLETANKVKENSKRIDNVFGALHSSVYLSSISASLDNLMIQFDQVKTETQMHYKAYMDIISALVSKNFLDPRLAEALVDASDKLPPSYGFLSDNIFDLVNSATITHEVVDSKILVNLMIPVVDMDQILYLFKGNPLPYQSKQGLNILPKYEAPFIAVTRNLERYVLIHPKDLLACQYKDMYLCNSLMMYDEQAYTCMYSHFINDIKMASHCHFQRLQDESIFELGQDHVLYYYVPKTTYGYEKCKTDLVTNKITPITLEGIGQYTVNPGCRIEIENEIVGVNPKLPNNTITRDLFEIPKVEALKLIDLPDDSSSADSIHIPLPPISLITDNINWNTVVAVVAIALCFMVFLLLLVFCFYLNCYKRIANSCHNLWYLITRKKNLNNMRNSHIDLDTNSLNQSMTSAEYEDNFRSISVRAIELQRQLDSIINNENLRLRNTNLRAQTLHENTHTVMPYSRENTADTEILSPLQPLVTYPPSMRSDTLRDYRTLGNQYGNRDMMMRNLRREVSNSASEASFFSPVQSDGTQATHPPPIDNVQVIIKDQPEGGQSQQGDDQVTYSTGQQKMTKLNQSSNVETQTSFTSAHLPLSPSPFRTLSDIQRSKAAAQKDKRKGKD